MKLLIKLSLSTILFSLLSACGSSPQSVVNTFYHDVEKGEISKASELLSKDTKNMLGDAKLNAALQQESEVISKKGGLADIKTEGETKAEVAFLIANVKYKNGEEKKQKIKLVKEDGNWKITPSK